MSIRSLHAPLLFLTLLLCAAPSMAQAPCVTLSRTIERCAAPSGVATVSVTLNSSCATEVSALGMRETIPANWTLKSVDGSGAPGFASPPGTRSTLEFGWFDIPTFPITFTYTLNVPGTESEARNISGNALYRLDGGEIAGATVQTPVCISLGGAPTLTLLGSSALTIECKAGYIDAGATAQDTQDGDLTGAIVTTGTVDPTTPGRYVLTYSVTDSDSITSSITREVIVADTVAPTIALIGSNPLRVPCGALFVDPGASASDACSTNLVEALSDAETSVNTGRSGTYTITYTATDSGNNQATVTRTVILDSEGCATANCGPTSFKVIQPLNDNVFVAAERGVSRILFASSVGVPEGESCAASTLRVSYTVNGTTLSSEDAESGYPVAFFLATGNHHVLAKAETVETGEFLTQEFTVSVQASNDLDSNGFPDQPFATLGMDGDSWSTATRVAQREGQTTLVAWDGDCEDALDPHIILRVRNPEQENQVLTVSVDRALLECGERGILSLSIGEDTRQLFGSTEAARIPAYPTDITVRDALFDISLTVSADDGLTYAPIPTDRLVERPVRISYSNVTFPEGSEPRFLHLPTRLDSSRAGFGLSVGSGSWTEAAIQSQERVGTTLSAEVVSLSLFAAFTDADPADGGNVPPALNCAPGVHHRSAPWADVLTIIIALSVLATLRHRVPIKNLSR